MNIIVPGVNDVVHSPHPPSTGSQKCKLCDGWIVSGVQYWRNNVGPICPSCNIQLNQMEAYAATAPDSQKGQP